MKNITRVGLIMAVAGGLVGAAASTAVASPLPHNPSPHHGGATGAVFAQTDAATGNTVVSYRRSASGLLTHAGSFATGGVGAALGGSVVDHTASQGSLTREGQNLFAVNAGSNTITSFHVDGTRLVRQQVVASGGDFPVSIAAHGDLVYVLNARGGGSIQGYVNVGGFLVKIPTLHRDLGFNPDPSPEFTSTPAQVAFTPNGTQIVVSTKGDGSSFDVFQSRGLTLSQSPVVSTFAGLAPFGITFDRAGRLVAAEAGPNAVGTFTINRTGTVIADQQTATGQQATCWIVSAGNSLYASNAGSSSVTTLSDSATALTNRGTTATDAGTIDASATPDGRYLYVQTGAAGIIDEYAINPSGALTRIGSVLVPDAAGGEGIVAW